jgi:uncharacterized damage-inducible protein DinB
MSAADTIAESLFFSMKLMDRYCADLKPEEYLHRITPRGNCAAWLLGHVTLVDRNPLRLLGATLPTLPEGFEKRFGHDETAPFATDFGDVMILLPLFDDHRALLIETVKQATPEQLNAPLEKPRPLFSTVGQMAHFMAQHATMHAGQITMIRRSLGRPPLN